MVAVLLAVIALPVFFWLADMTDKELAMTVFPLAMVTIFYLAMITAR
jgi:hypothetical protein